MNTDKAILSSMMVTLASTTAATVLPDKYGGQGSLPAPRVLLGTGLTYFGLSIIGDVAPGIAKPFALAIAVTALTYYGIPVLDNWINDRDEKTRQPVGIPKTP